MNILTATLIGLIGLTSTSRNIITRSETSIDDMKAIIEENAQGRATLVADINSYEAFKGYDDCADSVLIRLNKLGLAVDKENAPFASLDEVFEQYDGILKNFVINDEDTYQTFSLYMLENNPLVTDINILSNDLNVIKEIKFWDPGFRVGYDVSKATSLDYNQIRRDSNVAGAHYIISRQDAINYDTVESVQHLAKPMWVYANSDSYADLAYCYGTGAMGVITENPHNAIKVLYDLCAGGPTVFRSTLNIAHRGDATNFGENSLEGLKNVYGKGAQAFETDFHVTKDGEIVAMHDTTIDRTTNGTGAIAEMTLDEIRQYKIVKNCNDEDVAPCTIPTLDEIFEFMSTNDIILFAEIKCDHPDFAKIFKQKVDKYKMSDRIVIINFETLIFFVPTVGQLAECRKEMPEIWGLNLMWFDLLPDLTSVVESTLKIGYDANLTVLGLIEDGYFDYMRDRGFLCAGWSLVDDASWTPDIYTSIVYAYTNNFPYDFKEYPSKVSGNIKCREEETVKLMGQEAEAKVTNYVGEVKNEKGIIYSSSNKFATAIYNAGSYQIVYNLTINEGAVNLPLILGTSIPAAIILAGAVALIIVSKKKHKKE